MAAGANMSYVGLDSGLYNGPSIRTPFQGMVTRSETLKVACVFGTRPELIKFYPVLRELRRRRALTPVAILTSQHTDLVEPLLRLWKIPVDHDLKAMVPGQSLNGLLSRLVAELDAVFADEGAADIVLVQGDTTTALAGAMAAWNRKIPVGHIEAGLRSGTRESPFPEEMNRRLVTSMATLHFAPTERNVQTLLAEGIAAERVFCTGNPVVDAVNLIRGRTPPSEPVRALLERLKGQRILLLTTHRRESFGAVMRERLRTLRRYVEERPEVSLIFPVHPNPSVMEAALSELGGVERIELLAPLCYPDFLHCLAAAWLAVSDSGGVQEEAPTLGKPLLVIRASTERPEGIEAHVAQLVGDDPIRLRDALIEAEDPHSWAARVRPIDNPYGRGDSAVRIVDAVIAYAGNRSVPAPRV